MSIVYTLCIFAPFPLWFSPAAGWEGFKSDAAERLFSLVNLTVLLLLDDLSEMLVSGAREGNGSSPVLLRRMKSTCRTRHLSSWREHPGSAAFGLCVVGFRCVPQWGSLYCCLSDSEEGFSIVLLGFAAVIQVDARLDLIGCKFSIFVTNYNNFCKSII